MSFQKKFNVPIVNLDPRPNEVKSLRADCSLAQNHGYSITTDFWAMLDKYCDWRTLSHNVHHESTPISKESVV